MRKFINLISPLTRHGCALGLTLEEGAILWCELTNTKRPSASSFKYSVKKVTRKLACVEGHVVFCAALFLAPFYKNQTIVPSFNRPLSLNPLLKRFNLISSLRPLIRGRVAWGAAQAGGPRLPFPFSQPLQTK
jgi:hypothetical protein